mmetsp:Transcript_381/g.1644  ORF Transcript_381/g.1644 Transcript_381/m.1644 type:complete len:231 (+) Transcript_381:320-1012(+)
MYCSTSTDPRASTMEVLPCQSRGPWPRASARSPPTMASKPWGSSRRPWRSCATPAAGYMHRHFPSAGRERSESIRPSSGQSPRRRRPSSDLRAPAAARPHLRAAGGRPPGPGLPSRTPRWPPAERCPRTGTRVGRNSAVASSLAPAPARTPASDRAAALSADVASAVTPSRQRASRQRCACHGASPPTPANKPGPKRLGHPARRHPQAAPRRPGRGRRRAIANTPPGRSS